MTLDCKFRPIQQWPRTLLRADQRRRSPFKAGYSDTLQLLERELRSLGARQVVIQMDLAEGMILQDGSRPRADARPNHPGVIIAFAGKHGPMRMPCDEFTDWQANLRAIALTLERLRLADLYGVTRHGEQYSGWKKLPGSGDEPNLVTLAEACQLIANAAGMGPEWTKVGNSAETFRDWYRQAAGKLHPDRNNGDDREFKRLQQAAELLRKHHGL